MNDVTINKTSNDLSLHVINNSFIAVELNERKDLFLDVSRPINEIKIENFYSTKNIQFDVKRNNELKIDFVISSPGMNEKDIESVIDKTNPDPIIFYPSSDIDFYQIAGAKIKTALVFADSRLLANITIFEDVIYFNETVYENQQLFIQYSIKL